MANESFYFANGASASNIDELRHILASISPQEFSSHVNSEKNDFASWVEYSLSDPDLARKLRETNDLHEIIKIIDSRSYFQPEPQSEPSIEQSQELTAKPKPKKAGSKKNERLLREETAKEKSEEIQKEKDNEWLKEESLEDPAKKKEIEKEVEELMAETKKSSEKVEAAKKDLGTGKSEVQKSLPHTSVLSPRKHAIKLLLLGAIFGFIIGLIVMYIVTMNKVV